MAMVRKSKREILRFYIYPPPNKGHAWWPRSDAPKRMGATAERLVASNNDEVVASVVVS